MRLCDQALRERREGVDFFIFKRITLFYAISGPGQNVVLQTRRTKLQIQVDPNQLSSTVEPNVDSYPVEMDSELEQNAEIEAET